MKIKWIKNYIGYTSADGRFIIDVDAWSSHGNPLYWRVKDLKLKTQKSFMRITAAKAWALASVTENE